MNGSTPDVSPALGLIHSLVIAEFAAHSGIGSPSGNCESPDLFEIRTCQRTLYLSTSCELDPDTRTLLQVSRRYFEGTEAYAFLLRFACGLESEIKGETDVFGQVKTASKTLQKMETSLSEKLQSVFLKIFEDTKEIRSQYLQGIGGNTYGALARRLMNPTENDSVLIIGAGQIAKSVAPYFADFKLKIWNRSPERLNELLDGLNGKGYANIERVAQDPASLHQAVEASSIVILATPPHGEIEILRQLQRVNKKVLHLGGQDSEFLSVLESGNSFFTLTDLFGIEREQSLYREKQVHQALEACQHRAILRGLAKSISISHGWEDLALFY